MKFVALRKYKDGGEQVFEYFYTEKEAKLWIRKQPQPKKNEFVWCTGYY